MREVDLSQPHQISDADYVKYSETYAFIEESIVAPLQNAVVMLPQRSETFGESILLCGEAGSGKSSAVYYLARTHCIPVFTLRTGIMALKSTEDLAVTLQRHLQSIIARNVTCIILLPDVHNLLSSTLPDAPAVLNVLLRFLEYLSSPPVSVFPMRDLAQILLVGCAHESSSLPPTILSSFSSMLTFPTPSTSQRRRILYHIDSISDGSKRCREELDYAADKYGGATLVPCIIHYKQLLQRPDPILPTSTSITIYGHQHAIDDIIDAMQLPRKYPEIYRSFGITPPTALLLYGLPGTGKTLLARRVAATTGGCFVNIRLSDVLRGVVGAAEKRLRDIFASARRDAPTVLFIDEFQAMFTNRASHEHAGHSLTATLTSCLDDVAQWNAHAGAESLITVIAATNEPWLIDAAFLRGGRFDKCILVGPLDPEGRKKFLVEELKVKGMFPNISDSMLDEMVNMTEYYTGADIVLLLQKAIEIALDSVDENIWRITSLEWRHIEEALKVCAPSCSEMDMKRYAEWGKTNTKNTSNYV